MAELRFTRKAVEDLDEIWRYSSDNRSEQQADEYYRMLISSCRRIADSPKMSGRRYEEVADGLFGARGGRHIIFYRIEADGNVIIVRILHERMNPEGRI